MVQERNWLGRPRHTAPNSRPPAAAGGRGVSRHLLSVGTGRPGVLSGRPGLLRAGVRPTPDCAATLPRVLAFLQRNRERDVLLDARSGVGVVINALRPPAPAQVFMGPEEADRA